MTKKILLGLFILSIGAVSIIAYNFYKNVKQPVSTSSIVAVPQNAAIILQENNFSALYNKIASTNIIWEELISNTQVTKKVNNQFHYFDSLLNHSFKPLTQQPILTSIHPSGANNFDFIFYMNLPYDFTEEEIVQKIKNSTHSNPSNRAYDGVNIYTISTKGKVKIAFTYYKNIFAFSYSTVLIEDVIRQLNADNSLLDNVSFAKILNTSGQAEDGNIYINNANFAKITEQFLNPSAKKYSANFENYANWTELDVTVKPNSLMLNGFTLATDSSNRFLTLFKDQKPQNIELLSIAPANTSLLYYYGLSDSKSFFEKRKLLLKTQNQFFNYQKFIDSQMEEFEIDIEEELLNNIGNELALIVTEPLTDDYTKNLFIVFQSNNIEKAKKDLNSIALKVNEEPHHVNSFNEFPIHKIDIKNVLTMLLGKPFVNIDSPFYTIIDNYVVFGQTENAIKTFISDFINKKTLEKNKNFQAFNENLAEDANLFVYLNIARSTNLFKAFSKKNYIPLFDEKLELFRKFEAVAFQVNAEKNNLYYNNIYFKYNPVYKQDTRSLWELTLDTTISTQPQLVVNHKTNAKEIFVQDDANKIYLISNTGKVIWTKQLQEPIIGNVHQVDVYKNNKLQLLFNTKSKLYLIDRNGNNVEIFPIKLPSEATNGVTPLDYSNNRNYRLLIGCSDNMVYNYTTQGKLVDGWEYQAAESFANGNIWHFALSGKDYIVVPLQNGQIKIIQRNGKDRLNIKNRLSPNNNQVFLKVGHELSKTYLVSNDTNGIVTKLYFNDKIETLTFSGITANNTLGFYGQYIFSNKNKLSLFDEEKAKLFEIEFENNISTTPMIFKLSEKLTKIGLVSNNNLYLINETGKIEDGFPLMGSTLFSISDINNDKTLNLIVGDGNKLITYNLE
jgi:hypothetical protein